MHLASHLRLFHSILMEAMPCTDLMLKDIELRAERTSRGIIIHFSPELFPFILDSYNQLDVSRQVFIDNKIVVKDNMVIAPCNINTALAAVQLLVSNTKFTAMNTAVYLAYEKFWRRLMAEMRKFNLSEKETEFHIHKKQKNSVIVFSKTIADLLARAQAEYGADTVSQMTSGSLEFKDNLAIVSCNVNASMLALHTLLTQVKRKLELRQKVCATLALIKKRFEKDKTKASENVKKRRLQVNTTKEQIFFGALEIISELGYDISDYDILVHYRQQKKSYYLTVTSKLKKKRRIRKSLPGLRAAKLIIENDTPKDNMEYTPEEVSRCMIYFLGELILMSEKGLSFKSHEDALLLFNKSAR